MEERMFDATPCSEPFEARHPDEPTDVQEKLRRISTDYEFRGKLRREMFRVFVAMLLMKKQIGN